MNSTVNGRQVSPSASPVAPPCQSLSMLRLWQWAFTLIRRQMGQLKLLMACLVIGVFSLTATLAIVETFTKGLQGNGQKFLGGDIGVVSRNIPFDNKQQQFFQSWTTTTTQMVRLRSMVASATGSSLAEVKAVQANYPLVGTVQATGGKAVPDRGEVILDPQLARVLGVAVGDRVSIGDMSLTVAGLWSSEPDIDFGGFSIAPRALISYEDSVQSTLLAEGTQAYYALRGLVSADRDVGQWESSFEAEFPEQRLSLATKERPNNTINGVVTHTQDFFMVLSLAIAVLSGIGVQTAMRVYLHRNINTLAIFKSMGMTQGQVLTLLCMMIGILVTIISVIGAGLGAVLPMAILPLVEHVLPLKLPLYFPIVAMGQGVVFGILSAYTFASVPLLKALGVRGADLFRSMIIPPVHLPLWGKVVALAMATVTVIFVLNMAGDTRRLALFLATLIGVAGALYGVAQLCRWGLSRLSNIKNTFLRLAIANLTNRGNGTVHILVSVGMGLTLFTGVGTLYQSMVQYFQQSQTVPLPDMIVLDIKRGQDQAIAEILKQNSPEPNGVTMSKIINTRITAIDGVPASQIEPKGDEWFIEGDRRSTWLSTMPEHNETVLGQWWDGVPEQLSVSVEHDILVSYDMKMGSTIDMSVLGRPMTATVVHSRNLNFLTPTPNFAMIFSPGLFENAPYSAFATASVNDFAQTSQQITASYPNVVILSARSIVDMVGSVFRGLVTAVNAVSLLALVAGVLVLLGAMTAETERKTYNSVVLKMIGGTRLYVAGIFMIEYAILAVLAGLFSVVPGYYMGKIIATQIVDLPWYPNLALPLTVSGFTIVGIVIIGGAVLWRVLSVKPVALLRAML